jgi:hypothetical protein
MIVAGSLIALVAAGGTYLVAGWGEAADESPAVAQEQAPAAIAGPPAAAKAAPMEAKPKQKGPPRTERGIVANVPLFGPTSMATVEPAPLGVPPDDVEAEAADAVEFDVPDQSFDSRKESGSSERGDVKPWGQGRLHLPFVHRLKLDGPGVALSGEKKATGFSVFLPKRKVLDSGKAIARRDDRIIEVRTKNSEVGARVTFVFNGTIPAYKVRFKDSYVEFFVSSPKSR